MSRKIQRIQKMRTHEVIAEAARAHSPIAGQRLIADKYNFMPSLEAQRKRYAVNMTTGTAAVIFSASLDPSFVGDAARTTPNFSSVFPAPKTDEPQMIVNFTGANPEDPMVWPSRDPALLSRYPRTLFASGTRAGDMSAGARSHLALLKAGVESQLVLWDGLDHCFQYDPDMPESEEAYKMVVGFLTKHMR
jgi:epsilon-lactone hydrolase